MKTELAETATTIEAKLSELERERLRIGAEGIAVLKRLDPWLAKFAGEIWDDPEDVADWFTDKVESLGWRTPWQCIARGDRDEVVRILNSIAHGLPA